MIKTYEGFFDFFKRKSSKVNTKKSSKITYEEVVQLMKDSFIELVDAGYTVKNGYMARYPHVQITKHPTRRTRQYKDIPFKFTKVKDDVLSFCDRLKSYDIDTEFAYVYENDKGGLTIDHPTYQELESLYDDREVSILTIEMKIEDTWDKH